MDTDLDEDDRTIPDWSAPPLPPPPAARRPNARTAAVEALLNKAARLDGPSEGWTANMRSVSLIPAGDPATALAVDAWDADHVRLPCSSQNIMALPDGRRVRKWEAIKRVLSRPIPDPRALEAAIKMYNTNYAEEWSFDGLTNFFRDECTTAETTEIFTQTLPAMARMALRMPDLFLRPIPLLRIGQAKSITLNQEQVACLLANAFFCTYPRRNAVARTSEYASFPSINFNRLFATAHGRRSLRMPQKLRCIFHYFERIRRKADLSAKITYARHVLVAPPEWPHLRTVHLAPLTVQADGLIEDDGLFLRQMDFANKFIGGGALDHGLVQEEIRFMICPELIASMLFTEVMEDHEAVVITGVERFSNYTGYSDTFAWDSDHVDPVPIDPITGHRRTEVAAIDAISFHRVADNFEPYAVERELVKAAAGFWADPSEPAPAAIATGLWGCGAFRGDPHLKTLVQLMAAAVCRRGILFFTFSNAELSADIADLHTSLVARGISVADLYHLTMRYCELRGESRPAQAPPTLFDFLRSELGLAMPHTGGAASGAAGAVERDMALDAADMDAATLDALLAQSGGWTPLDAAGAAAGGTSSPPPVDEVTQVDHGMNDMQVDGRDVSAANAATQLDAVAAATQQDAVDDATQLDAPPDPGATQIDPGDDPGTTHLDPGAAHFDPGATQIDAPPS